MHTITFCPNFLTKFKTRILTIKIERFFLCKTSYFSTFEDIRGLAAYVCNPDKIVFRIYLIHALLHMYTVSFDYVIGVSSFRLVFGRFICANVTVFDPEPPILFRERGTTFTMFLIIVVY